MIHTFSQMGFIDLIANGRNVELVMIIQEIPEKNANGNTMY